jgi:hypothetical protein
VLLIERGGSPYGNPLVINRRYYGFPLIQKDNNHMSVPEKFTSKDGVSNVRGRVLGGSPQIAGITEDLKIIVEAATLPLSINKSRVNIAMPLSKGYLKLNNNDPRLNPTVKFHYQENKKIDVSKVEEMKHITSTLQFQQWDPGGLLFSGGVKEALYQNKNSGRVL